LLLLRPELPSWAIFTQVPGETVWKIVRVASGP
jgi:hypothetical protein